MLNLIKYEIRKQITSKAIFFGILGFFELLFLYGIIADKPDFTIVMCIVAAIISMFYIFYVSIEAIFAYNNDLKQKSGYMLFMVPHSEYTILGAKLITAVINILFVALVVFLLGGIDTMIAVSRYNGIQQTYQMIQTAIQYYLHIDFDLVYVLMTAAIGLFQWIGTLTSAFLAITFVHTVLSQVKCKGFLSFVGFILINIIFNTAISFFVPSAFDNSSVSVEEIGNTLSISVHSLTEPLLLTLLVSLLFAAICFILSGWMLHKKLSL